MWIDMFPIDELPLKPSIDITPQPPVDYELRVIVWNTEDVPLVDNQFLTGEKCSDIYVKGYYDLCLRGHRTKKILKSVFLIFNKIY